MSYHEQLDCFRNGQKVSGTSQAGEMSIPIGIKQRKPIIM